MTHLALGYYSGLTTEKANKEEKYDGRKRK